MKWWGELCSSHKLFKVAVRKVEPIITWIPWKPVARKNVDPYTESEKEKLEL